jgi:uncharacterized protein (DUF1697 family)
MTSYIALLRAVNVGGTGKLPMADLKALCVDAGFDKVQTYIASGNIVFESQEPAAQVKSALESRLHAYAKKPIDVFLRTAAELRSVLAANPFKKPEPKFVYAFFLGEKPPPNAATNVKHRVDEEIHPGKRELYVYYPQGMGQSKMVIPAAARGTARNMNTVAKLLAMSSSR